MYLAGPAQRLSRYFRQTDMANFTLFNQIGHSAHHLFHRYRRIDAVLIEQIDGLDIQSLQRPFH